MSTWVSSFQWDLQDPFATGLAPSETPSQTGIQKHVKNNIDSLNKTTLLDNLKFILDGPIFLSHYLFLFFLWVDHRKILETLLRSLISISAHCSFAFPNFCLNGVYNTCSIKKEICTSACLCCFCETYCVIKHLNHMASSESPTLCILAQAFAWLVAHFLQKLLTNSLCVLLPVTNALSRVNASCKPLGLDVLAEIGLLITIHFDN